jgi:hypothetical protein
MAISKEFSGSRLRVLEDFSVIGFKGYNSCMLNHPICEGAFYFEVTI